MACLLESPRQSISSGDSLGRMLEAELEQSGSDASDAQAAEAPEEPRDGASSLLANAVYGFARSCSYLDLTTSMVPIILNKRMGVQTQQA